MALCGLGATWAGACETSAKQSLAASQPAHFDLVGPSRSGRKVNREARIAGQVFESVTHICFVEGAHTILESVFQAMNTNRLIVPMRQVTTDSFPHFEKPVPVQYVVEVLDIMWELGYDGHNLQEIARELEEEGIDFRSGVW